MSALFTSFTLKNLTLKNRIVMAPMCMYTADQDGNSNGWHTVHYGTRAVGGVGLILLEATAVEARGRISDRDLGLWKDEQVQGLRNIVETVHGLGAKIGVQLAHAGRKSTVMNEACIAPSPIPFSDESRTPVEMSRDEIKQVVLAFGEAARRAELAGFDVIEVHGAHGYLINEFLSPLTNKRTDEYGGCLGGRMTFLREVLQAVRSAWPQEKPIILRVSAEEYEVDGNHPKMLAAVIKELKAEGIDLVNVSSGGVVNTAPRFYPGYQVKYAETIREDADIPVMAGGLISSPQIAEEIIRNERADLIFLGRELLRNPYWTLQAAKELREDLAWPEPYIRAK